MRAYVDSDILIWHLRGQVKAAELLRRLARETGTELCTGALQRAELVFFMRPNEQTATRTFLARFKTEPVSQAIVDRGAEFYHRWHPSHDIQINEAILAATAAMTGGRIYTQNVKHFPMPDVIAVKGW